MNKGLNKKWKDIYNENKKRKYCSITRIKKEDIEIESNSFRVLKEKKYLSIFIILLITLLLVITFKKDIKVLALTLGFFIIAGICFFVFNYFKLKCTKEGLYIQFGIQSGTFSYDKIKSIYLSRFSDYSFIIPSKGYNIVVRYLDNTNRLKELSFPNHFLNKQETIEFLENFEIEEEKEPSYISFEKYKLIKKIIRLIGITLFVLLIIGAVFYKM